MTISYLTPTWNAPINIRAITTLRQGGVSEGHYSSFNLAGHVGDKLENVQQNRFLLREQLQLPSEPIWLEQVHGCRVIQAQSTLIIQQADASFTDEKGVVCAVMTADCLPVLICSRDGSIVAAIHAGWKGLLNGIITHTIQTLLQYKNHLTPDDLFVWFGPAIGKNAFEIGEEVYQAFIHKSENYLSAFYSLNNKKYLADIYQIARIECASLGIYNCSGGEFCTFNQSDLFYSYRRDGITGRMATLIWIE